MNVVNEFLDGNPSVYDVASYVVVVVLLITVISMHFRQMRHARAIRELRAQMRHLTKGAIRNEKGEIVAYEDESGNTGWVIR